jgi:hypothetical protein
VAADGPVLTQTVCVKSTGTTCERGPKAGRETVQERDHSKPFLTVHPERPGRCRLVRLEGEDVASNVVASSAASSPP